VATQLKKLKISNYVNEKISAVTIRSVVHTEVPDRSLTNSTTLAITVQQRLVTL